MVDWVRAARISAICVLSVGLFGPAAASDSPRAVEAANHDHDSRCAPAAGDAPTALCVHGEDPPPEGAEVDERRNALELASDTEASVAAAGATTTSCVGDGVDGKRVQALYVVASDKTNRAADIVPLIRQWAAVTESSFVDSAAQTGGVRRVRWVHDAGCELDVDTVVIGATADDTFGATITAVKAAGYTSSNRKYLMWVDANVYCGIAQLYPDSDVTNNLNDGYAAMFSRVDNGCWGYSSPSVEAHELMHNLGAVQSDSPNHSPYGHCLDDNDTMCYADGPGVVVNSVCPGVENERLFDCNKDDYFSTAPAGGSYLATHWNTANSGFLHSGPHAPDPNPDPDPDPDPDPPTIISVTDRWSGRLTASAPTAVRSATPGADGLVTIRYQFTGTKTRIRIWNGATLVADLRPTSGSLVVTTSGVTDTKVKVAISGPTGMRWILRMTYSDVATPA